MVEPELVPDLVRDGDGVERELVLVHLRDADGGVRAAAPLLPARGTVTHVLLDRDVPAGGLHHVTAHLALLAYGRVVRAPLIREADDAVRRHGGARVRVVHDLAASVELEGEEIAAAEEVRGVVRGKLPVRRTPPRREPLQGPVAVLLPVGEERDGIRPRLPDGAEVELSDQDEVDARVKVAAGLEQGLDDVRDVDAVVVEPIEVAAVRIDASAVVHEDELDEDVGGGGEEERTTPGGGGGGRGKSGRCPVEVLRRLRDRLHRPRPGLAAASTRVAHGRRHRPAKGLRERSVRARERARGEHAREITRKRAGIG